MEIRSHYFQLLVSSEEKKQQKTLNLRFFILSLDKYHTCVFCVSVVVPVGLGCNQKQNSVF